MVASLSSVQGTIFGNSIPELGENVGYRMNAVLKATKLTQRQLDHWITKGYFKPSLNDAQGSGNRRLFTFKDIVILKTYKSLLDAGVTIQKIAKAKDALLACGIDDLSQVTLFSDGKQIFLAKSQDEIINILQTAGQSAQGVFAVSIASIWSIAEGDMHKFKPTTVEEESIPPSLQQIRARQKELNSERAIAR